MRSSPVIRNSPLTVNTHTTYETSRHNVSSPRNFAPSPSPSPVNRYYSSAVTHTPLNSSLNTSSNSKINSETYKVTSHTYKSTLNQSASPRASPITKRTMSPINVGVDYSSNIAPFKSGSSRRDSWDVINKTKHMFSNNSLESLANLTESQLNTNLSYDRPKDNVDNETHSNTQYNKFSLVDSKFNKSGTASPVTHSSNYHGMQSTIKERNEKYVTTTNTSSFKDNDYGYSSSKFLPISNDFEGAKAIKVSNKPDGFLGLPFEFEIDGSRAGSGNLEILVNGGRVTSSVRALGGQRFVASFTPHEIGIHTVQITFNGETVPGKFVIDKYTCSDYLNKVTSGEVYFYLYQNTDKFPLFV